MREKTAGTASVAGAVLASLVMLAGSAEGGDNPRTVVAVRVAVPPRVDGMLNDEAWKRAAPATGFIQRDPEEGRPASERSEIRVVYDDEALYFGCFFYDSDPAKIVARLTRRDNQIESDGVQLHIDAFHDHQTACEFTFNAAGVKGDIIEYDDGNKTDASWDPVWYVETMRTDSGWTAEVKIPFSTLRYSSGGGGPAGETWGINFIRYISRKQETDRWAFSPKSESGFISRFGLLTGLRDLPEPHRLELLPFVLGRQDWEAATPVRDAVTGFDANGGLDMKYGLSNNFVMDATFNPDFGQVEADPAVLNLTTIETFYPEQRPFFVEGTQIIHFTTFGDETAGPGMFYSRRIGRAITAEDVSVPTGGKIVDLPNHVAILGAAKVSGKTDGGLSVGLLQAVTRQERATVADSLGMPSSQVVEPFAHYNVLRMRQDVLNGSNVGMIVTSVEKESRAPALTGGADWKIKFINNTYQVDGFLGLSRTTASDASRQTGAAGRVTFSRIGAEHWLWSFDADFTGKKFNINDVGFFRRPNDVGALGTVTYKEDVPSRAARSYTIGLMLHERYNFDGANLFRMAQLSGTSLFANYWNATAQIAVDGGRFDDRETRGNGLYRKPLSSSAQVTLATDQRDPVTVNLTVSGARDEKRKRQVSSGVDAHIRMLSWMDWEIETDYTLVRNQEAWVENVGTAGGTASIFADRSTDEHNLTVRGTLTFARDLTLQVYSQLFLAKGHFEGWRQLVGTSDFVPYAGTVPPDFNEKTLNVNVVLRWEYSPGSTLFLVWSQARTGGSGVYASPLLDDLGDAFAIPPSNVLLLKINYWWNI